MSIRKIKLPPDTPGRLAAVGVFLYGNDWRVRLAGGLGICRNTLYWWLRGVVKQGWDVDGMIIDLLDAERDAASERGMEITALRKQLMSQRAPTC